MFHCHFCDRLGLVVPITYTKLGPQVTINGQDRANGRGAAFEVHRSRQVGRYAVVHCGGVAMVKPVAQVYVVRSWVGGRCVANGDRYVLGLFLLRGEPISLIRRHDSQLSGALRHVPFARRLLWPNEVKLLVEVKCACTVNGTVACADGLRPLPYG